LPGTFGTGTLTVRGGSATEDFPLDERVAVSFARPPGGNKIEIQGVNPDV